MERSVRSALESRRAVATVLSALLTFGVLTLGAAPSRATSITDGLTPGLPTVTMPYETSPGVWNEVDNATGQVTGGIICAEGCPPRAGFTFIWNPIGANSLGQYYTNGLYVAQGGQYVLPGSKVVRAPDGTPLTPEPVETPAPPPSSGGISGVDVLVIQSNGARCYMTTQGWWYGDRSCVGRDIQFTVCFISSDSYIYFSTASWGFSLKSSTGAVLMSDSYPGGGTVNSGPSCASGNIQSWHYQQLEPGSSYTIEAWGTNAGQTYNKTFTFSTAEAPIVPPPSSPESSPTTSATAPSPTTSASAPTTPSTSGGGGGGGDAPSASSPSTQEPARCTTDVCGYAVVDSNGVVHGVIVCSDWCTGRLMEQEYMGCPPGCRLIVQGQQTADGNVAGWHGPDVRYDDSTRSFTLPGGGSISSGARMEDAVFPQPPASAGGGSSSPTSSATAPPPDVIPSPDVTTSAMGIMGTSGTLYSSLESYVVNESVVAVSASNVSVRVPAVNTDLGYVVYFDPAGSRPAYEVARGEIESNGVVAMSGGTLSERSVSIARSALRTSRGVLVVALQSDNRFLGWVSTVVQPPKKYSNCKALRKDYPSGVSRAADVVDKGKRANSTSPLPVVNPDVYARNTRLDADKDGIACEV